MESLQSRAWCKYSFWPAAKVSEQLRQIRQNRVQRSSQTTQSALRWRQNKDETATREKLTSCLPWHNMGWIDLQRMRSRRGNSLRITRGGQLCIVQTHFPWCPNLRLPGTSWRKRVCFRNVTVYKKMTSSSRSKHAGTGLDGYTGQRQEEGLVVCVSFWSLGVAACKQT